MIGLLTSWNDFFLAGSRVLFAMGRGAMIAFANVGSFCIAAALLGVSFSFLKLRKDFPDQERPQVEKFRAI